MPAMRGNTKRSDALVLSGVSGDLPRNDFFGARLWTS